MKIKICLAEDNYFLAKTIQEKISFFDNIHFKFHANNGAELIGKLEENSNIDVILMDIQMPEMNGITATEIIKKKYPHIRILILTVLDDDTCVFNAIRAGANGYLLKEVAPEKLYNGILEVCNDGAPMTPSIALKTLNLLRNPILSEEKEVFTKLSKRETEILLHLSKGLNYSVISENLIIAPSTVRKHIENIYKKLHVHNKIEAVLKGKRNNII